MDDYDKRLIGCLFLITFIVTILAIWFTVYILFYYGEPPRIPDCY